MANAAHRGPSSHVHVSNASTATLLKFAFPSIACSHNGASGPVVCAQLGVLHPRRTPRIPAATPLAPHVIAALGSPDFGMKWVHRASAHLPIA